VESFNKLNAREDMTLQIVMRLADHSVSGTITVRTMFRFGINVTRVSWEAFTASEEADLDSATGVMRAIYERRDLTFDFDRRGIPRDRVGGFEMITSEDEARDLFAQWSGPDTNQNIDVFIAQIVGTSFDGLVGGIPGQRRSGARAASSSTSTAMLTLAVPDVWTSTITGWLWPMRSAIISVCRISTSRTTSCSGTATAPTPISTTTRSTGR
jgi:hypothetical protein